MIIEFISSIWNTLFGTFFSFIFFTLKVVHRENCLSFLWLPRIFLNYPKNFVKYKQNIKYSFLACTRKTQAEKWENTYKIGFKRLEHGRKVNFPFKQFQSNILWLKHSMFCAYCLVIIWFYVVVNKIQNTCC